MHFLLRFASTQRLTETNFQSFTSTRIWKLSSSDAFFYAPTPATTWIMDNSAPYDSRIVLWLVHKTTNQARSALLDPIRFCHLWLQAETKVAPRVSSLLCSRAEWLDYPQIPGSSFGAVWGCCFVHICLLAIVTVTILRGTPKCDRRNS